MQIIVKTNITDFEFCDDEIVRAETYQF